MRVVFFAGLMLASCVVGCGTSSPENKAQRVSANLWQAPDSSTLATDINSDNIRYGRDLIAHTARYLGPKGTVAQISNGMNCQNCHLESGTKPFGNNFGSVASLYPRYRERSGSVESMEKRVNDCLQRSLNGSSLDSLSREMRAIVSYFQWLGKDVPRGTKSQGSGLLPLAFMERAADTTKGKSIYLKHCTLCHQRNGSGQLAVDSIEYLYPPLWGDHSFNTGAGLYRISNMARYVFANMPWGATHQTPTLQPEEAWDVSGYILSMPRPTRTFPEDWPNLSKKPIDHPFGPYTDSFTEAQHKYGPFGPIEQVH